MPKRACDVVTPAEGFGENPRSLSFEDDTDDVWAVYPFVSGDAYKGDPEQISAAGGLLGRIHAAKSPEDFALKMSETVVAIGTTEIDQDVDGILNHGRA